jgi:hypothetical protein
MKQNYNKLGKGIFWEMRNYNVMCTSCIHISTRWYVHIKSRSYTLFLRNTWMNLKHVWGPVWIDLHWNSIWLRAWSHMTSHYTWRSMTTLHDFGGVSGRPLDTFFWALTISWSWLVPCVWSGPNTQLGRTDARFHNAISCHMLAHIASRLFFVVPEKCETPYPKSTLWRARD